MTADSKKRLNEVSKEICSKSPKIISITGNTNPNFSSNSFDYHLIDFGDHLLEINFGNMEKVTTSKRKWIKNTIDKIHSEYTIVKIEDSRKEIHYVVTEIFEKYKQTFLYEGRLCIDSGGVINILEKEENRCVIPQPS